MRVTFGRLALFTGSYDHIVDGVSLTLNRLVEFLVRSGTEVLVFGPTSAQPVLPAAGTFLPVPSVSVPVRPEYRLTLGLPGWGVRALERFRPDLVHVATPDPLGWAAQRWARRRGVPVVGSFHTNFPRYLRYYGAGRLEGWAWRMLLRFYGRCEEVYVPAPSVASLLRERGLQALIRVWGRGVDAELFHPARRSRHLRRVWRADRTPVVLWVSRLAREKGVLLFVRVVRELRRRRIPHRSVVVGEGPMGARMQRDLPGTFFLGSRTGVALARVYASADVFLFPSDTETFGNVTLEAMASGLPVVGARAPGTQDLVVEGVSGFLARAGDADGFREVVQLLLRDPEGRARMGRASRKRAEEPEFRWETVLARAVEAYRDLLSGRKVATSAVA